MTNEKYLSDLKDFMDNDSDLDSNISGIDYNDYSKFITDIWNCGEDKIDWYNVCFSDYNGGGGNKHERDAWNNEPYYSERKGYITMAILNEACLNNRLDIAKFIYVTDDLLTTYETKFHTWLDIFTRCIINKNINIEIVKWILKINKEYNCYEGIRESDLYDGIDLAWKFDNKNVIELFYNINPNFICDPDYETIDNLFTCACKRNLIDIANWFTTINNKCRVIVDNDIITNYWVNDLV